MRILSLDDAPEMARLLGLILELAGYQHQDVHDSHEALAILRARPPDLFTQDVMRPGTDGLALYEQMKADEALREVPVLFISAGRRPEFAASCRDLYGDGYLNKPFAVADLLAAAAAVLARHGRGTPSPEERAARYPQVRARWAGRLGVPGEHVDLIYERVTGFLAGLDAGPRDRD
jgi:DNA-binding response OmpR family regulator